MVHASLRMLGPVEDGAAGLIDSICSAIGRTGSLVMVLGSQGGIAFDKNSTPADPEMGVLAEEFRKTLGVVVNDHPAARFGVLGPMADELLTNTPWHDYYGKGSVLERFVQARGKVLRLGADTNTMTIAHWAEYLANVPNKKRVSRTYPMKDSEPQVIHSLDDCEGILPFKHGDYFHNILSDYKTSQSLRVGSIGQCEAELIDAKSFVEFATRWIEKNLV